MYQDRIGTVVMLLAGAWMASLAFTDPGEFAAPELRRRIVIVAVGFLVVAFFPQRLNLTGTVLAIAVLGLGLNIGLFGLFGMTWEGLLPAALMVAALWLRRNRLDNDAVVVISAAVAGMIAIVQPQVIMFAITAILVVNIIIWMANLYSGARQR